MNISLFKKHHSKYLIVSLDGQMCRALLFETSKTPFSLLASAEFTFSNQDELANLLAKWSRQANAKGAVCRWVLGRELYKTYNLDAPNVLEKEMAEAIKWQIKDLLDIPVANALISYYRPKHPNPQNNQVVAVAVEKSLVEFIIGTTLQSGLELDSIEIDELASGQSLHQHLKENSIIGYIYQDSLGTNFSFYHGQSLAFSRHKKSLFIPETQPEAAIQDDEFLLEDEASSPQPKKAPKSQAQQDKENAFLLETQRTLDYVVSQLFRKPVELLLLLDDQKGKQTLADMLFELTETQVKLVSSLDFLDQNPLEQKQLLPTLAEIGCLVRSPSPTQFVNFYFEQYHPQPLTFNSHFALTALAVSLLGLVIIGWQESVKTSQLEQLLQNKNQSFNSIQNDLNEMQRSLAKKLNQQSWQLDLEKSQKELNSYRHLVNMVNLPVTQQDTRYSQAFEDLARHPTESVWITRISISASSIDLYGSSDSTEQIPKYIEDLSQLSSFNRYFGALSIERDPLHHQLIHFELTNGKKRHEG